MDVRHLELLRELAERGSVTAVARASHRTVSAVSQQLRTAQREFGMQLVEPAGRGVRLTDAGRLLAAGGIRVQTAMAQVQADWDAYCHAPGGSVSVMAFPSAAAVIFPAVVAGAEAVGIDVHLTDIDAAESDFASYAADFDIVIAHSVGRQPLRSEELVVEQLEVEPLDIGMAASHRLAAKTDGLMAADVVDASWIGVPDGYPFDAVLRGISRKANTPLDIRQRLRDNRVIEGLVRSSDSLAVLPRFTTAVDDSLVLREIVDVAAERTLSAVMRPDRAKRRAVRTVLSSARKTLALEHVL